MPGGRWLQPRLRRESCATEASIAVIKLCAPEAFRTMSFGFTKASALGYDAPIPLPHRSNQKSFA
jgi:hypothetical protein